MTRILLSMMIGVLLLMAQVQAGILIEFRSDEEGTSTVRLQGDWARLESAGEQAYLLMDLKQGKGYVVSPEEQSVLVLDFRAPPGGGLSARYKLPPVRAIKEGRGPRIAGYSTTRYRIAARSGYCFIDYIARDLLEEPGMRRFLALMALVAEFGDPLGDQLPSQQAEQERDTCELAELVMSKRYSRLGVPLRSIRLDGTVTHEITHLDTKTTFPVHLFRLPEGYEHITVEEMMQMMRRAMEAMNHDEESGMPPSIGSGVGSGMGSGTDPGMESLSPEDAAQRRALERRIQREMQEMETEVRKMEQQIQEQLQRLRERQEAQDAP